MINANYEDFEIRIKFGEKRFGKLQTKFTIFNKQRQIFTYVDQLEPGSRPESFFSIAEEEANKE
jgi:hypothetical protein